MRKPTLLLLLIFLLWTTDYGLSTAHAAIPRVMNYQGKATDKQGAPLNGSYNLTFRIYNAPTGGTAKWSETQANVAIANGVFQVQLGSVTSLNLQFDEACWISLEISTDGEMSPRTKLASVPYAYKAESSADGVPSGAIMAWAADNPPSGWFLCDGSAISRTTYANLFSAIGTTYGSGDGVTTFNLPDLKGRVAVGKSIDIEFTLLGQKGGEKTHTLTVGEMPAHHHTYYGPGLPGDEGTTGGGNRPWRGTSLVQPYPDAMDNAGGGAAHNNLQPYITLNYIIKT